MNLPRDPRLAFLSNLKTSSGREAASASGITEHLTQRHAPRILVVDDNPGIAALMSQLLSMRGYDVAIAADAQQAEAEVKRQAPDLILSDVRMPGKSGYELCHDLKENPATRLIVSRAPIDANAKLLRAGDAEALLRATGLTPIEKAYFLYLPERLYRRFGIVEDWLNRIPAGGQYAVFCSKC